MMTTEPEIAFVVSEMLLASDGNSEFLIGFSGNVIGYHVTQPCEPCMDACNNGHFWMFHCTEVSSKDRTNTNGMINTKTGNVLVWSQIPRADKDMTKAQAASMSR
jgi:FAM72 protein